MEVTGLHGAILMIAIFSVLLQSREFFLVNRYNPNADYYGVDHSTWNLSTGLCRFLIHF